MASYASIVKDIERQAGLAGVQVPTLIAVSKTKTVEQILEVYQQGHRIFGENYVQELLEKTEALRQHTVPELQFHFIGRLQRNKVKALLPRVTAIHSVDSMRLLEEIDKQSRELGWTGDVYIQVNIDQEESKGGFMPGELPQVAKWAVTAKPQFRLRGLMCIPDPDQAVGAAFTRMAQLRDQFGDELGRGLSMGMSSDYRQAIECGATCIRIGSAIFGARE